MIIITVHYPQRELIPKILLAHKAATRYGAAIIGRTGPVRKLRGQVLQQKMWSLKFKFHIEKGVIIEMATTPEAAADRLPSFKNEGFNVVSFCEEATAFPDPKTFASRRLDKNALDIIDLFLSWGKWHQEAIDYSTIDKNKLATTGHPRFEIYQEKYKSIFNEQIDDIKKTYGERFILVNTNIPEFALDEKNYNNRKDQLFKKVSLIGGQTLGDIGISEGELEYLFDNKRQSFKNEIDIVNNLIESSTCRDFKVVLRPKPSVAANAIQSYATKLGYQGKVDGRYSIVPWLYACSAVLHQNCTTGIEAALLGKPAIMLDEGTPIASPVKDASIIASNAIEVVELLKQSLNDGIDETIISEKLNSVKKWHENIESSPSDKILSELNDRGFIEKTSNNLNRIHSKAINLEGSVIESSNNSHIPGKKVKIDPYLLKHTVLKLNDIFSTKIGVSTVRDQVYILQKN